MEIGKNKNGKKAIGIAMAAIILASIFAMFPPTSFAQPPVPSGKDAIYYMEPDNSTVPGYCDTTTVGVWLKTNVPTQVGDVNITYTHCCANITSYEQVDFTYFDDQDWADPAITPGRLTISLANSSFVDSPAGVYHLGNFTVHCCDTDSCCVTNLLFDVGTMSLANFSGAIPFGVDDGTFTCGNPIAVTKHVQNETGAWVKQITKDMSEVGNNVTFKTTVHAECCELTNLVIWDNMTGLNFSGVISGAATAYVSPDKKSVQWTFPLQTFTPCSYVNITFNATIENTGTDCNVQTATAICDETGTEVSDDDEACVLVGAPDLIVDRIDPQYVFESGHNLMMVVVKNIGQNAGNTGNTSLVITNESSGVVFEAKNETSIPIAKDGKVEIRMGWWQPTALENITLNATADCDDDIDEMGELNNTKVETRNTTGDCTVDDMLPYTCFGYGGQHPMDTVIKSACNRSLIYTAGDYRYKNTTVHFNLSGGDTNRITNDTADIPVGAAIKTARLYVYYCWRDNVQYGYPDLGMEFGKTPSPLTPVSEDLSYTDGKGWTPKTYYGYGTIAYDVTNLVNGAGVYTAEITDSEWVPYQWKRGAVSGMALLIVYEHESVPHIEYYIDEGCDRLATMYYYGGRWQYYLAPEDATTNATFPCINNPPEEIVSAKLFTATIDANAAYESLYFNNGSWTGVWAADGSYPIGTNTTDVTAELQGNTFGEPEVARFQDRDSDFGIAKGGFTATNAILIVEKDTPCVRISVEPQETIVQPQDQFEVMINVSSSAPVYGVEYYLTYNASVVRAETQTKGPFLGNYSDTMVVINNIDQPNGIVSYAETRKVPGGVTGEGTVAKIQFTAIGARGAMSALDLFDIIIVDEDKQVLAYWEEDGTVEINDNTPPVSIATSKHRTNNVAKKYPCITRLCACKSYDPDYPDKGGNITYIRWAFGDGQYGTSEGAFDENCQKEHKYESWQWAPWGVPYPDGNYVPFNATLTVTDDGCPEETNSSFLDVTVYIAGDANGDGRINILDAVYVGKHWGERCDDGPDPELCCYYWTNDRVQPDKADLNNDCVINILDAVIIGAMWGHTAWE